ncbi:MAG: hypothetical protein GVX96_06250 [Bacteroidetes bacterium]|jgi:hypothetical protein|nr:hypothetical protein [Bacteroidota bacterium]
MNFPFATYKEHFSYYAGDMTHAEGFESSLTSEESYLLRACGLPKKGVPYLYFDTSIHKWRNLPMDTYLMCLGTCEGPRTRHYIFLGEDHRIYIRWANGHIEFVNSSLSCLMRSILVYSEWLESIEEIVEHSGSYLIQNEDIFELYYQLRTIDPQAVTPDGLWVYLMEEYPVFEMEQPYLDERMG